MTPLRRTLVGLLALIASAVLLAAIASPAFASKGCGDVNKDGVVNSLDAVIILQVGAAIYDPGLILFDMWDLDEDGAITSVDALLVLQYEAQLTIELPECYG
jgi:hypothetical protein